MRRKRPKHADWLNYGQVESRLTFAVDLVKVDPDAAGGDFIRAWTDDQPTRVDFRIVGETAILRDLSTGKTWEFVRSRVTTLGIFGGAGNDVIINRTNVPSMLFGYGGNDRVVGGNANDIIDGGDGNDSLNGRGRNDIIRGGNGRDTLIAIDGFFADQCFGESGNDVIWCDQVGNNSDQAEAALPDIVHKVAEFVNGADRTLNGDSIADPGGNEFYKNFRSNRLFGLGGPNADDLFQGQVGDCPVVAMMSSVAAQNPSAIRNNMVAFGDGTFGVHLGGRYVRIDADLPMDPYSGNTQLRYADLGHGDSIWAPLFEKAIISTVHLDWGLPYVFDSLRGVDGGHVLKAFGCTDSYTRHYPTEFSSSNAWLEAICSNWDQGKSVAVGVNVTENVRLIGSHVYSFMGYTRGVNGKVESILLRNPWGNADWENYFEPNNGYVVVSPEDFLTAVGDADWGATK